MILGTQPGSTLDGIGRAFTDLARQTFPSLPLDVRNLEGTSSLLAFKDSLRSPGNGTVLYFLQGSLLYLSLSGSEGTETLGEELASVTMIGSFGADRRAVFVAKKLGIETFDDLVRYDGQLVVPAQTAASGSFFESMIVNTLTGSKLKPVGGYTSAERKLAILSGEAQVAVGSIDSFSDLVDEGVLVPLLRLNDRGPDAPYADRPLLGDVATGPDADILVKLVSGVANTNNFVSAPPGLSTEQIAALTELFDAVAPKVAGVPNAPYGAAEAIEFGRDEVLANVGALFVEREAVATAFSRAQACGAQLAEGGACA